MDGIRVCVDMFSLLLGKWLEVELLILRVDACLTFRKPPNCERRGGKREGKEGRERPLKDSQPASLGWWGIMGGGGHGRCHSAPHPYFCASPNHHGHPGILRKSLLPLTLGILHRTRGAPKKMPGWVQRVPRRLRPPQVGRGVRGGSLGLLGTRPQGR